MPLQKRICERRPKFMDPAAALLKIRYTLLFYGIYPILIGPPTEAFHRQTVLVVAQVNKATSHRESNAARPKGAQEKDADELIWARSKTLQPAIGNKK